ncbi:MAG TPA: hypothetical protein VLI05_00835 [Candidatus Saccharimonadia bacterium]|nr:hypothetical protein [Candidatus Saccharimonadia bacterium]
MKDYTITELTKVVKASFAQYDVQGTRHWTWRVAAQDLSYQIGSLHKVMLQLSNDRYADGKDQAELEEILNDELADILAEVLYIASERGIDMNQAMAAMVKSDRRKVKERTKSHE